MVYLSLNGGLNMNGISIKTAAALCGGYLNTHENENTELGRIIIDSREVKPGDLFAAFKGENTDGHDYIDKAFEMGAACCLVSRIPEGETRPLIKVGDVEKAMELICAGFRKKLDIPVIGITGSVGKTSAKEMAAAVLSQHFNILKTDKNLNNTLGVPITLSRIEKQHQAAVIEMGISDFGEMSRLANMCKPNIAVFTMIGKAHLEFLHDRQGVFKAKTEMLAFMPADGIVIANGDDDLLRNLKCRQRLITFGFSEGCDVRAENIEKDENGYTDCVISFYKRRIKVHIPAFGEHMVYAALEGAALGCVLGLEDEEIAAGIANYKTVGRRAAFIDTGKVKLIDDCYNANPDSVNCGIDSLSKLSGRKVCILGDMLELGENEKQLHYSCGKYAADNGVELVLTCGELSRSTAEGAGKAGRHFESREELIKALPELIHEGDNVLVKASHRQRFDEVSEAIKSL